MKKSKWDNCPSELRDLPNWVYYRLEERNGKNTKIPYNAKTGHPASTTDPATWSTYEQACRSSVNGNGIGFVFAEGGGYVGLDIDHAVDNEIVSWFDSYAERSQSGKGVHIIMRGQLPKRFHDDVAGVGRRSGDFELYERHRYFVMTGDIIHKAPIRDCQGKLDQFILEVFPAPKSPVDLSTLLTPEADPPVIDRIRSSAQADKFNRLWAGEWQSGYHSQSDADAALLSILRFWTGGNMEESFALFRQSGLMREKANRADYLPRTWRSIDKGDVYKAVEPVPADFIRIKNQNTPPWRNITISHAEAAIAGTLIYPMVQAFRSPTDPPLPLEVGLAKALAMAGCALSGKSDKPYHLGDRPAVGGDMSRVRIMTAGGQTPNFWTLLVGESGSGKDIGGIVDKAAKAFKWAIGNAGSEEGIADAYIKNPTGLLTISEMINWLDSRHWQSRAARFLTEAFSKGWFSHAMSRRGDCLERATDYCFPNVCACIQPGILSDFAKKADVDSGFLGRFLVLQMPENIAYPVNVSLEPQICTVIRVLKVLQLKEGTVSPEHKYNQHLSEMFAAHKAQPVATWRRLASEYYPRLALLLSFPEGDTSTNVEITDDGWRRAGILVNYLFAQAEAVFSTLHYDPAQGKFEALCLRLLTMIENAPGRKMMKAAISYSTGRGTKSKERDEALNELVDRGSLVIEQEKGNSGGRPVTCYRAI